MHAGLAHSSHKDVNEFKVMIINVMPKIIKLCQKSDRPAQCRSISMCEINRSRMRSLLYAPNCHRRKDVLFIKLVLEQQKDKRQQDCNGNGTEVGSVLKNSRIDAFFLFVRIDLDFDHLQGCRAAGAELQRGGIGIHVAMDRRMSDAGGRSDADCESGDVRDSHGKKEDRDGAVHYASC
jgi:hypothetical protein